MLKEFIKFFGIYTVPFIVSIWYLILYFRRRKKESCLPLYPAFFLIAQILLLAGYFFLLLALDYFSIRKAYPQFFEGFFLNIWWPVIFVLLPPSISLIAMVINLIRRKFLIAAILSVATIFGFAFMYSLAAYINSIPIIF